MHRLRRHAATISVALCTHNGERFIDEQVRSICLQTRRRSRSCSPTTLPPTTASNSRRPRWRPAWPSGRACRSNCASCATSPALRVTKNFEQAALACRGDLIALSDQDDVWLPDRLARMAAEFEQRPELAAAAHRCAAGRRRPQAICRHTPSSTRWRSSPSSSHGSTRGRAFDVFLRRNLVTGATTVLPPLAARRRPRLSRRNGCTTNGWRSSPRRSAGSTCWRRRLIDYRQHENNQIGAGRDSFAGQGAQGAGLARHHPPRARAQGRAAAGAPARARRPGASRIPSASCARSWCTSASGPRCRLRASRAACRCCARR